MKLVIGNKKYSSWSLRPWIALKVAGIPFEEQVIPLYKAGSDAAIRAVSPAGKVPILVDGDVLVWETIAILEYLADKFPSAGLWPAAPEARAHARAIAAEMHAGFAAMRINWTFNIARAPKARASAIPEQSFADARRIEAIFADTRKRFGAGGPFLFGARFCAADAMYAPVVARLHHYAVPVSAETRAYMDAVMALPAWREWVAGGLAEPADWVLDSNELD
jgi:glutathione S-transferase